jgi:sugar lactone lactonase YvrE
MIKARRKRRTTLAFLVVGAGGCGDFSPTTNGIALNSDGQLVVAFGGLNVVRVIDPDDGAVVSELSRGVRVPDDVEVDARGVTWWTGLLSGEIGRSDGTGDAVILADLGTGANSLALSPAGELVVGRCGLGFGGELFALDPDAPSEPRLLAEGLGQGCALNGMVFGSDGLLYGAQPGDGRVVRLDVATGALEVLADGLSEEAYAVALDPAGNVFALDGERVVRVENGVAATFVELPVSGDNLVFGPDGVELFVTTGPNAGILAFDAVTGASRVVFDTP